MAASGTITIVGASLAAVNVIRALRGHGFDGRLVLIGEEPHLPYDRPPLSKQLLTGRWDTSRLPLEDESFYDDIELRPGTAAAALRPDERQVELADGTTRVQGVRLSDGVDSTRTLSSWASVSLPLPRGWKGPASPPRTDWSVTPTVASLVATPTRGQRVTWQVAQRPLRHVPAG